MGDLPGVPLSSGMTRLPDDEQEVERENWRRIQREMQPLLDEHDRARRRAEVEARFYVVGGS